MAVFAITNYRIRVGFHQWMNEFKTCDVYMYNGVLLSHKEK
jgi:hypothetical protein